MALRMRHPDVQGLGECLNQHVFDTVWAHKGWEVVGDTGEAEAFASRVLARGVESLEDLKLDDLRELAAARGYAVDSKANLKSQLEAYKDSFSNPEIVAAMREPTPGFVEASETLPDTQDAVALDIANDDQNQES